MDTSFIELLLDKGILIVIAIIFFKTYQEDRQSNKEDRDRANATSKDFMNISTRLVEVVQDNKSAIENSINCNTEVIETLTYTKESHEKMDKDMAEVKEDLKQIREIISPNYQEIVPKLKKIEKKLDEIQALGKTQAIEGG